MWGSEQGAGCDEDEVTQRTRKGDSAGPKQRCKLSVRTASQDPAAGN